jgi:glycosyltransferase involved in cell wall biosynthesis
MNEPLVSVLMPVYNGARFLEEAVQSILNQTFEDFELLIINDGSTDESEQIINGFKDPRIRLVNKPRNEGLVKALNDGIGLAKGTLIARMDADDIAHKDRLSKQVAFLKSNPDIDVLGCHIDLIDERQNIIGERIYGIDHDDIKIDSLFHCPVPHPGVIFKKDKFISNNLFYNPAYQYYAEDYDLWQRALAILKFANYNEKLLLYRITVNQASSVYLIQQKKEADNIRLNYLRQLGLPDEQKEEQTSILNLLDGQISATNYQQFENLLKILSRVTAINTTVDLFKENLINPIFSKQLDRLVRVYTNKENKLYSAYKAHHLFAFSGLNAFDKFKISCKEWML